MQDAKILFSPQQFRLLTDSSWILTKNAVVAKLYEGLGNLSRRMEARAQGEALLLPQPFAFSGAKISRGENFQGLPYLMLDYPRVFGREAVLAIRTFVWWGRFASITLHASGPFLLPVLRAGAGLAAVLEERGFVYAALGDEWNHDLESEQYKAAGATLQELERGALPPFLKIAGRVDLQQWPQMEEELFEKFLLLVALCREKAG